MNFIDIVFFVYTFVALYMIVLMIIIYLSNRGRMFNYPKGKIEPVSIVMSCWNAKHNIGNAVDRMFSLDWPKDKLEVIVVDDCSTDGSQQVIKEYAKKYKNFKYILRKKNSGGAATPQNDGIRIAKNDYIAVADDDSFPESDALKKMIGFLQKDKKVGAVTCSVLVKKPKKFIEKIQAIEYVVISFGRRLLDFVDSVYVTPGPFALYRKKTLIEVGLFDKDNMTQDIEIVYNLMSKGYKARMALDARVYVDSPKKLRGWWRQRVRWNIGGTQTLIKYKNKLFRNGMLGLFVIPFFSSSLFIGVFGIGLFLYLTIRRVIATYFTTTYSVSAGTALFSLSDISFNPTVLNYFGFALFLLGSFYIFFGIITMREWKKRYINFYSMIIFLTVYLTLFPLNLIDALFRMAIGKYSW